MKVVNPTNDSTIPELLLDEPFMLWCPDSKIYYRVVIMKYDHSYSNDSPYVYVIKDTQTMVRSTDIKCFTVRDKDTGRDLYKSLDIVTSLIKDNEYEFTHLR